MFLPSERIATRTSLDAAAAPLNWSRSEEPISGISRSITNRGIAALPHLGCEFPSVVTRFYPPNPSRAESKLAEGQNPGNNSWPYSCGDALTGLFHSYR